MEPDKKKQKKNLIEARGILEEDSCLGQYPIAPVTMREKMIYFKDYYLKRVVFIIIAVLAVVYILYVTVYAYKATALSLVFIESGEMDITRIEDDLTKYLDLEGSNKVATVERIGEDTAKTGTVLPTRIAAGDIDIMIGNLEDFQNYSQKGAMETLEKILSKELLEKINNNLIYAQVTEVDAYGQVLETYAECPYGVSLKETAYMKEYLGIMPNPVIGVIKSSDDYDMEVKVLEFFLNK